MRRALVIARDAVRAREIALDVRDRGFAPAVACTGAAGVAEARLRTPDIVIIDPDAADPSGARATDAITVAAPRARVFVLAGDRGPAGRLRAVPVPGSDPRRPAPAAAPPRPVPMPRPRGRTTTIGALEVDLTTGASCLDGRDLGLTPRERALVRTLVLRYGEPVTRDEIGDAIWGHPPARGSRVVDVLVRRLRRKVDEAPGAFTYIQTDPGVGYRLEVVPRSVSPDTPRSGGRA